MESYEFCNRYFFNKFASKNFNIGAFPNVDATANNFDKNELEYLKNLEHAHRMSITVLQNYCVQIPLELSLSSFHVACIRNPIRVREIS